jgi:enoyl-CoA hydratase
MNPADYETILVEREGRVLKLTMNRPDTLNAVNSTMHEELSRVFTDAQNDKESDIVVLTGAGRGFSAGGDVDWFQESIDDPSIFEAVAVEGKQIVYSLLDLEKPIIAKINGPAMGLGATIALFCDVIFADEEAKIADPHVRVGLVAGDGGAVIWPQLIGYARAKEYLMTGDAITGKDAEAIGLINHAVPRDELDARTDAFVQKLLAGAMKSIRWTKVATNIGLKHLAHNIMDIGIAYELQTNISEDHQEAVNAFRDKRKPNFTGK